MTGVLLEAVVTTGGPAADRSQSFGAAILASLLLVLLQFVRNWTVVAHEGGHALFGALFGARVHGVRLVAGGGGVTGLSGLDWIANLIASLTGYLGPSIFGLGAALLLHTGHADAVLWVSVALLGLLLVVVRNLRALFATVTLGLLLLVLLRRGDPDLRAFAAHTWAWLLLIGAVADVALLRRVRREERARGGRDTSSDAYALRALTFIPAALWVLAFFVGTTASLLLGASLLLDVPLGV